MTITPEQVQDIADSRSVNNQTIRPTVKTLEDILYKPTEVLDHGFVRVIDYMGDDSAIVQAARVSYGKGTKKVNEDANLIRYLLRHGHTTPFEMCEIKFHIKIPIFVARQWIRHRTANVNEYSARYSEMDNEFYIPSIEDLAAQSTSNHQGRGDIPLSDEEAEKVLTILKDGSQKAYDDYKVMLNANDDGSPINDEHYGLARELARMNLPTNIYTQWYWKIDLHNLLNFLALRSDSHAQYEIRVYANAMLEMVKAWCPVAYQAFMDYRKNGCYFSSQEMDLVKALIDSTTGVVDWNGFELGKRELKEFTKKVAG